MSLTLEAPAKINLTLEVIRRRGDGFHELRTLMANIGIRDRLSFKPSKDLALSCNDKTLDCGPANLVMKAAALLRGQAGVQAGARIRLEKRIPTAAGLAGGSADAAATLKGLARLWKLELGLDELKKLAGKLGSDIPYCVQGGLAVGTGRGEKLKAVEVDLPPLWVVVLNPGFAVPTKWVYQNLKLKGPRKENATSKVLKALKAGRLQELQALCDNDLESVTAKKYPAINQMKASLMNQGALASRMSGSGPSVWALFPNRQSAKQAETALKPRFSYCQAAALLIQAPKD